MKVYPLLLTSYDFQGNRDLTIVVEVFDSMDAAFNYAIMLAETEIQYPTRNLDIEQNIPVSYEYDKLRGFVNTLDENKQIVNEFTIWAETVRNENWHA